MNNIEELYGGEPFYTKDFLEFWSAYPYSYGKINAYTQWQYLRPSEELKLTILKAVEEFKKSSQWQDNGGRYIPKPANWLKDHAWEAIKPEGWSSHNRFYKCERCFKPVKSEELYISETAIRICGECRDCENSERESIEKDKAEKNNEV